VNRTLRIFLFPEDEDNDGGVESVVVERFVCPPDRRTPDGVLSVDVTADVPEQRVDDAISTRGMEDDEDEDELPTLSTRTLSTFGDCENGFAKPENGNFPLMCGLFSTLSLRALIAENGEPTSTPASSARHPRNPLPAPRCLIKRNTLPENKAQI
jgi:hypothetical protein